MSSIEQHDGPRIAVVRHGETEWNRVMRWQGQSDIPLNDAGREQAKAFASSLREHPPTRIVSSDLARAVETAQIVSDALDVPMLAPLPSLRERSYGVFEGLTRDECIDRYGDLWQAYITDPLNVLPDGAEPRASVIARALSALHELAARMRSERLLVVAHGGLMRMVQIHLTGAPAAPIPNVSGYLLSMTPRDEIVFDREAPPIVWSPTQGQPASVRLVPRGQHDSEHE